MKTFFEPVQGMAGIEEIKKSFSRLGHAVMVSGCIDTQKAHLLEALGEQYPIRVVITSDEVKARQLREDCLFFDKSSIYYPAKDFIFYSADVHGNQLAGERLAFTKSFRRRSISVKTVFQTVKQTAYSRKTKMRRDLRL